MGTGPTLVKKVVWRSALFWDIMQRIVVIPCRRFGTTYRSLIQGRPLMGPIGCPESSVRIYQCALRDILEERNSHLLCNGSLKSRNVLGSKHVYDCPSFVHGNR
jgi:hypothetical protein